MDESSCLLQALHSSLPGGCKVIRTNSYLGDPSSQGLLDVKVEIKEQISNTRECIWKCMTAAGKSMHWPGIVCSALSGCALFITPVTVDIPDIARAANTRSYWQRGSNESGGDSTKAQAKLRVVSLGLFMKWFAGDPDFLSQYALVAFDEFDEAKYGNVAFSTVLVKVRARLAELNIKLALLSATVPPGLVDATGIAVFDYSKRKFPLTTLDVEIDDSMDAFDVITDIGRNLLGRGHTSICFFPGEGEISNACERGGKEFYPFHAKLTEQQIDAARKGTSWPRCVCSSSKGEKGTTIPDIDVALCAGVARVQRDVNGFLEHLDVAVDDARCFQRMSRAGRTHAGVGLRILRTDLPNVWPTVANMMEARVLGLTDQMRSSPFFLCKDIPSCVDAEALTRLAHFKSQDTQG